MITEDKEGNPVPPRVNWKKALPRKPNEDEQRAIESLYVTNPVTGEKLLDYRQLNYKYEIYDYTTAALRRNRLLPEERNLNTDVIVNPNEVIRIRPVGSTISRIQIMRSTFAITSATLPIMTILSWA